MQYMMIQKNLSKLVHIFFLWSKQDKSIQGS